MIDDVIVIVFLAGLALAITSLGIKFAKEDD